MTKFLIFLIIMLIPISSHAIDKKIGATNSFKFGIFDTSSFGNGGAGLTYNTDYIVKVQCGSGSVVIIDGTGDTITDEGGGYYRITTNDTISPTNEDECLVWAEGKTGGSYEGLIAKTPMKFKAIGATIDAVIPADDSITATKIAAGAIGLPEMGTLTGTITTGSCTNTATQFDTTRTDTGANKWRDAFMTFAEDTTTSELRGQTKPITASDPNGCLTVRSPGFTTIPQSGDTFFIINK